MVKNKKNKTWVNESYYWVFFLHRHPYFYLSRKCKYFRHLWNHAQSHTRHTQEASDRPNARSSHLSSFRALVNNAMQPCGPPHPCPACVHVSVLQFLIRCQTWSLVSVTPPPFPLASPLLRCLAQQTEENTSQHRHRRVACGHVPLKSAPTRLCFFFLFFRRLFDIVFSTRVGETLICMTLNVILVKFGGRLLIHCSQILIQYYKYYTFVLCHVCSLILPFFSGCRSTQKWLGQVSDL